MQSKENHINGVHEHQPNKQIAHPKQTTEKAKRNLGSQRPQQKREIRNGNDGKIKKNEVTRPTKREAIDVEIEDMAKKMRLDNEKKMAQLNVFSTNLNVSKIGKKETAEEAKSEDWTSIQGQFGWAEIANTAIPYIIRSGEKYVSLRMADNRIFAKYKNVFTDEVRSCFSVKILHVTSKEAQLLNEINFRHCDNFYGRLEFSMRDGIICLKDIYETYDFLNFCHLRLIERISTPQNRCGFIKIAAQNCVPYTWHESRQYVPLFYFEGECKYLEEHSIALSGWALAYVKLYCKIQGIRKTLYEGESMRVVELDLVKKFFPPDTLFEDNWPDDYNIDSLIMKPAHKVVLSQIQSRETANNLKTNQNNRNEAMRKDGAAAPQKKQAKVVTIAPKEQVTVATIAPKVAAMPQKKHFTVAAMPQKEHLIIAPTTAPTAVPSAAVVTSQPPTTSLACLNNNVPVLPVPSLRIYSNQNLPRPKSNVMSAPSVLAPRTIASAAVPVPNSTDHQKTIPTNEPNPVVTVLNNLTYRQPFLAKPLIFPCTYQRGSRMLQIPEVTCNNAYFVLRTQVEDKFFQWCINLEPFMTTILLVTLEETASFFQLPLDLVVNAVNVMNVDIFIPNRMQRNMLERFKMCHTKGMLKLREFIDNLPQLRYILDKTKNFD